MGKTTRNIKSDLIHNLLNIPGWKSQKKIIVIESDDWGSIRMPSMDIYNKFIKKGLDITHSYYNRLDTLESNDDLSKIFEVLSSHKNTYGNHPVITANVVTGNPDFKKIRQTDFTDYFFEPVIETLKRYPGREHVATLWGKGNEIGIFHPQFHGREHVNVVRWMSALRTKSPEIMFTFENETTFSGDGDYNFMEVLDYNTPDDLIKIKESLAEGLDLFERIFNFRSKSFIPPCYTWGSEVESTLYSSGIRYIQGLPVQLVPTGLFGRYSKRIHFLGNRNSFGQHYLIRNCFFEPSLTGDNNVVDDCLNRIKIAFRWNKPAIISSHRINFVGSLDIKNRDD